MSSETDLTYAHLLPTAEALRAAPSADMAARMLAGLIGGYLDRAAIAVQPPAASQPSDAVYLRSLLSQYVAAEEEFLGTLECKKSKLYQDSVKALDATPQPPAASQPSDGLERAFRQLDERARPFAESHNREKNEYAAGITDALTIIRAALAAVQEKT